MTTLKWTKIDNYYIKSDGYTITKCSVKGDTVYTAFMLPNTILGHFKSVEDAKKRVSEHINDQHQTL